ncbi:hypothetical protein NKJ88_13495 [Mesorhizobium sp. M0016]
MLPHDGIGFLGGDVMDDPFFATAVAWLASYGKVRLLSVLKPCTNILNHKTTLTLLSKSETLYESPRPFPAAA